MLNSLLDIHNKQIGILDADLISKTGFQQTFPNLALMKISSYLKRNNNNVKLLLSYSEAEMGMFDNKDYIFISKVFDFSDEPPSHILKSERVISGGTGFFREKEAQLPYDIEHIMPDYTLYQNWVASNYTSEKHSSFKEFLEYSVGFLTRGCFRKCPFCVNKRYDRVEKASPLEEFYDSSKPYICLLDDNFLAYSNWREELQKLIDTNKPFIFKQGLDMRLITNEKAELLAKTKQVKRFIFAFDNLADSELIEKKLQIWRKYHKGEIRFYVLAGFYDKAESDVISIFKRLEILCRYPVIAPYLMTHKDAKKSEDYGIYINLKTWINSTQFFYKMSFREWCHWAEDRQDRCVTSSTMRYLINFEKKYPEIAKQWFDIRFINK